jgi:hypothetical protein
LACQQINSASIEPVQTADALADLESLHARHVSVRRGSACGSTASDSDEFVGSEEEELVGNDVVDAPGRTRHGSSRFSRKSRRDASAARTCCG